MSSELIEIRTRDEALALLDQWVSAYDAAARDVELLREQYEHRIFMLETRLVVTEAELTLSRHWNSKLREKRAA